MAMSGPATEAASAPVRPPLVNRTLAAVLRSPLSGLVDASLMLVTLRGRRTGREVTLPVQYAVGDDALWIWPGHPQTKTWWRNLRVAAPVRLRLRGEQVPATARVVTGGADPVLFGAGVAAYGRRFRRAGPGLRAPGGVLVRVAVPADVLARARRATVVPGYGLAAAVRRHPLGAYFLLTYLLSWGYWVPLALAGGRPSHFPGLLGPMLAALAVTPIVAGRAGVADLGRRMVRWRVPIRWYATAAAPLVAAALALAVQRRFGVPLPGADQLGHLPGLPELGWLAVFGLTVLINGYGEETGWRGLAWPRLRERHSLGGAALILAVPWALWHLPAFWLDTGLRGFPPLMIPGFLIGMAAGAVVLGWLYEHARSSILVVAVFHAALNMASATKGTEGFPAAMTSTVIIFWAVLLLRRQSTGKAG